MTHWKGKRVLVTGAGGFIGSHLTERLVEMGAKTRALVLYTSNGSWEWLDQVPCKNDVEVVTGDIRDPESVSKAMRQVDIVFHLAALISIPYSYESPRSYLQTNLEGTFNILEAARQHRIERLIHTSTSEVYGTARQVPIKEDHPLQGQSPYSASKIAADKMAEAYHLSFDLPVVTVRPFNTFGPRQSARAIIPTIITQCLSGGKVRLGNLTPTRDLNYVSNTVDGFIKAAESSKALGQTVHFGSGREISVGDLAQLIGRLTGHPVDIEQDSNRRRPPNSEVERLLADNTRARQLLDWEPKVSLEEGLRMTIEWIEQNMSAYKPGVYAI